MPLILAVIHVVFLNMVNIMIHSEEKCYLIYCICKIMNNIRKYDMILILFNMCVLQKGEEMRTNRVYFGVASQGKR